MTSSCPNCGAHLSIVRAQDARNSIIGTSPAPQPRNSEQPSDADPGTPTSDSSWDTLTDSSNAALDSNMKDVDSSKKDLDSSKKDLDFSKEDLGSSEERRKLKELICSDLCDQECKYRPNYPTFRQFLSEDVVGAVKPGYSRETLDRVTSQMEAAIRRAGKCSVDALLTSKRLGRNSSDGRVGRTERVFQAIGAIVYDMEWIDSGEVEFDDAEALADAINTISPTFHLGARSPDIFELMLLIDYGFPAYPFFASPRAATADELYCLWAFERFSGLLGAVAWRWRQGQAIPGQRAWNLIVHTLETSGIWKCDCYTWDAAIMFHYYYTCREFVGTYWDGRTGYTGVLQEMVNEVPTRGTDRLERKLSLDVHYLIPTFVKDQNRRVQMISIAKDLASRHGCKLELRNMAPPDMAPPDTAPPDMALPATLPAESPDTLSWGGWLGLSSLFLPSLFSSASSGERIRHEENRGENEKLLEGQEKEQSGKGGVDTDNCSEKTSAQSLKVVKVEQGSGKIGDEEML